MTVAVRVIPCLDVDGGRVVKGVNFRDLRDAGDPVELAALYDAEGADELTFLDITASSGGRDTMYDVVRRTAEQVFIPLTVGGGVRSAADVDRLNAEGCARYVVTDVLKDGTLRGPNLALLRDVCTRTSAPVVASGGVSSLADLRAIAELVPLGVEGAIVGTALYEGAFTLEQALAEVSR